MRKLENKVVIWAMYFDNSKTRSEGRRVPKRLALTSPQLKEVVEAAEALKLNHEAVSEVRHPRGWWQKSGYVIIRKAGSKSHMVNALAGKMVELRRQY